jgi:hypothetical protein
MAARKSAVDLARVYDRRKRTLRANYSFGVEQQLPPGLHRPEQFWRDLKDIARFYLISEQARAKRQPPAIEIERWQRILEETTDAKPHSPLAQVRRIAKSQLAAHREYQSNYAGNTNANRKALYIQIIALWTDSLGQQLGASKPKQGKSGPAHGPFVRFFEACVNPLLGKPLSAATPTTVSSTTGWVRQGHFQ